MSELDNPVWWSLTGRQQHLGTVTHLAARFDPEVSPFGALADAPTDRHWEDLATIVGPDGQLALVTAGEGAVGPGPGWDVVWELAGVQMIGDRIDAAAPPRSVAAGRAPADDEIQALDTDDVADMLALVAVAQPGPFLPRTVEFGGYVGVRRGGQLIAMAGERLRPPGYAEVSAVATHPDHRRQGLAETLVNAVVSTIVGRGEIPFLHAAATNTDAIRLYRSMGFTERRRLGFAVVRAPAAPQG